MSPNLPSKPLNVSGINAKNLSTSAAICVLILCCSSFSKILRTSISIPNMFTLKNL